MNWLALIIASVAAGVIGWLLTVLWYRRQTKGVVFGEIRARVEEQHEQQLEQERGRTDQAALDELRKNYGGGE